MTLGCYYYPLFPTVQFEYKRISPGLQAVFLSQKAGDPGYFRRFSLEIAILKQMFDIRPGSLRKIENTPQHKMLCQGVENFYLIYKIQILVKKFA